MSTEFDAKQFIKTLPIEPGVYQMWDKHDRILYIGKAKNLKKRVSSYFQRTVHDEKTRLLVCKIHHITITITPSEVDALLLENNLIKENLPPYNILLRDDKSYPYIFLSSHKEFPRLDFHRGARRAKGRYYGPYPNSRAVRETILLLQKLFKIRQCGETFFHNRTRPCLQYQIKRCTAPCVNYVTPDDYEEQVQHAVLFLEGRSQEIINNLVAKMNKASKALNYEEAAKFRDQITYLRRVQAKQYISRAGGDVDVIAASISHAAVCVHVISIRAGNMLGSKSYFPKMPATGASINEVFSAFLTQYYLNDIRSEMIPKRIIVSDEFDDRAFIANALSKKFGFNISIVSHVRSKNLAWQKMALANAEQALGSHIATKLNDYKRFEALQSELHLSELPSRIECFDVSHTQGKETVASCVVFTREGPQTNLYRRFNIKGITPGDDYAALKQVLTRRYTRLKQSESSLPDVILIDGGKGQLNIAESVLEELQVTGVLILSIVKGLGRKAEYDRILMSGRSAPIELRSDHIGMHLLQHLRDEAHRFAIQAHRKQRAKKSVHSPLQDIPGVGPKRRRDLLHHFGGLQELKKASVVEIATVPGISKKLAQLIYDALR